MSGLLHDPPRMRSKRAIWNACSFVWCGATMKHVCGMPRINWNLYLPNGASTPTGGDMSKLVSRTAIFVVASAALVFGAAGAANAKHHPHGFSHGRKVGW